MGREWKPGDVAVTDYRGVKSRAILVGGNSCPNGHPRSPHWHALHGGWNPLDDVLVTYRPLVVIDPEDRGQVERFARAYTLVHNYSGTDWDDRAPHNRDFVIESVQAALRSLVAPPRPEEPGTWGVVTAACVHSDVRRTWMRSDDGNWWVVGTDTRQNPDDWDSLVEPVVIREGVTA